MSCGEDLGGTLRSSGAVYVVWDTSEGSEGIFWGRNHSGACSRGPAGVEPGGTVYDSALSKRMRKLSICDRFHHPPDFVCKIHQSLMT